MILHSRPTLDQSDYSAVLQVLKSGHLVQGGKVGEFENVFSSMLGVEGAAAVSSGTSALHLALLGLDVQKGDEIILPSFVCSAPLNAILYTGAVPVVADIDRHSFNIEVDDLKHRISTKTKAIILPHMFGLPADVDSIISFGIPVIEDCAHTLGSRFNGAYTGSFGNLAIFSFYATKMIATGEGGMVTSDNKYFIKIIKNLRDYDEKELYKIRYNYKMTDIQAALGISQLTKLHTFIGKRTEIADRYNSEFRDCNFEKPLTIPGRDHVFFRYVILHEHADQFIDRMTKAGVACRKPVFKPLHRYISLSGYANTEWVWKRAVSIPIYPSLSDEEISRIVELVKRFHHV